MYLKLILCSMSIMAQLKKTQLPPLEDPLVLLFIAELIIFSPNLLLLSAALLLLEPLLSSQASSLKLQRCLTPYFQGPSTEKEHHLHLSFLSTSSVTAHSLHQFMWTILKVCYIIFQFTVSNPDYELSWH